MFYLTLAYGPNASSKPELTLIPSTCVVFAFLAGCVAVWLAGWPLSRSPFHCSAWWRRCEFWEPEDAWKMFFEVFWNIMLQYSFYILCCTPYDIWRESVKYSISHTHTQTEQNEITFIVFSTGEYEICSPSPPQGEVTAILSGCEDRWRTGTRTPIKEASSGRKSKHGYSNDFRSQAIDNVGMRSDPHFAALLPCHKGR